MVKVVVMKEKVAYDVHRGSILYGDRYTYFKKYIAENGNAVCTVNSEVVAPNDGNEIYRELKAKGAECTKREVLGIDDAATILYIEEGIDKYVEYIDNGRQYDEAKAHNKKLYKIISEFRKVAKGVEG